MVAKEVEIIPEVSFIKIISYSDMIALGYEQDNPEMCICADKTFRVKEVKQIDDDLRHVYVYGSNCVFIDADIVKVSNLRQS